MTWDGPNLPVDLTLTTASEPLTWTRSRLECSAWTLTALFAQVLTAIEPPKLFTSRRAPGRTGIVVSVWASAAAVATARIVIMQLSSSALRAGEGGRLAEQFQLPPHRVGEVMVEICAARVRGERAPRRRRGRAADPHGDLRPEVGPGRPVVERARPGHDAPQLFQRRRARRTVHEVRLERRALPHGERAVQVFRKPVRPVVLRHRSLPSLRPTPYAPRTICPDAFSTPSSHGAAAISTFPGRCRACRRSRRACNPRRRAARTPGARRRGAGSPRRRSPSRRPARAAGWAPFRAPRWSHRSVPAPRRATCAAPGSRSRPPGAARCRTPLRPGRSRASARRG